jgi:anti-sigma B factor antagonist
MSVRVSEQTEAITVFLADEIDLEHSPEARKALLVAFDKKKPVIADLQAVTYIDSSGVASLVEAYQKAQQVKQSFALARVSESAMKVLALARLDKVFTIR